MKISKKTVLLCDCEGTMPLDGRAVCKALGSRAEGDAAPARQLCRAELDSFTRALGGNDQVLVACTQEAPLFEETRAEGGGETAVAYANIRERAGWSAEAGDATPKIAALLAEAALDLTPAPGLTLDSEGVTLVYGNDESAIAAGKQLAGRLDVTVLLTGAAEIAPPAIDDVPVFRGTITAARGHLGAFEVNVDGYAPSIPSSRGVLGFEPTRDGAASTCDLILDLSGGAPLFPAHGSRDGYFRPDPGDPAAVQRALFDMTDMVGEFEKPIYVNFTAEICAHSRARITGCTRCLDVCPTSAITPAGDHVAIDPLVCGGCGHCASVCPTGAATYQLPAGDGVLQRLRTLLASYLEAGGTRPALLIHDGGHGSEMIGMMARHGRGLPARVLPFQVNKVTQVGVDLLTAALAYGAGQVRILAGPADRDGLVGLAGQLGLAETVMGGLGYGEGRVGLIDDADPEAVEAALYDLPAVDPPAPGAFLPMGGKRTVTMLALRHLREHAPAPVDVLALPAGAPFGRVAVDVAGCTLCLACVGACPTGALIDDPDRPMLSFSEDACVQCSLCKATCPESVITLEPRINFAEDARGAALIKQEQPYHCIRCGRPFATRGAIERIAGQLAGKHSMFLSGDAADRIRMCDDCRVIVQFDDTAPMAARDRPIPRTTDDYLREREIEEARAKLLQERAAESSKAEAEKD